MVRTVYVNDAAVKLLKASSAEEIYSAQVGEISSRFAIYDERGQPIDFRSAPGVQGAAGRGSPEPLLVRNVVRATGEERWLVNRVSVLRDRHGNVDRVVNVIEDVTDVKQQEHRQRLLAEATRALSGVAGVRADVPAGGRTWPCRRWRTGAGVDLPSPDGAHRAGGHRAHRIPRGSPSAASCASATPSR
jgi:hypothetical protein